MGVYSIRPVTENSVIDMSLIEESKCDINLGAAYTIMAECEANYNNLLKAIGIAEFNTYEKTGAELIYESVTFDAFIDKIKSFFTSLLAKIGGVVKHFKDLVTSWVQKDDAFVKAHEAELKKITTADIKDMKYSGWDFNDSNIDNTDWVSGVNTTIAGKVSTCGSYDDICKLLGKKDDGTFGFDKEAVANASKDLEDKDSIRKDMAGAVVGKSSIDEGELRKELHALFYNAEEKSELSSDIDKQLGYIKNTKSLSETADKNFKKISDAVSEEIKKLNALKSELKSKAKDDSETYSAAMALTNKVTASVKYRLNLINMRNTAQMEALKNRNTQARSVCVKALMVARKAQSEAKPAPKQEGFNHYTESGTFFDAVNIL